MLHYLLDLDVKRKTSIYVLLVRNHKDDTLRVLIKANLNLSQKRRATIDEAEDLLRHAIEKGVLVIWNELIFAARVPLYDQVSFEVMNLLFSWVFLFEILDRQMALHVNLLWALRSISLAFDLTFLGMHEGRDLVAFFTDRTLVLSLGSPLSGNFQI